MTPPPPAKPQGLRREALILVTIWAVPAAFMVLQMYATAMINQTPFPRAQSLVPAIAEWLIWVPFTPLVIRLARRYPLTWPPTIRALGVHLIGVAAAAGLRGTVYATATFLVGRIVGPITFGGYLWRITISWLPMGALVWGAILAGGAALDYARRLRDRELRDAALREQLARAELGALRARLHPHFLFNALHSVGALVRGGQNDAAVRVVAELSEMLRDVISRDAPEMVRLRDELAFVRRYLDIEAVRFADRLRVEWNVDAEVNDAVVPSLVVQPLVENAMRHAVSASWAAGRITIAARRVADDMVIEVSDDGPGLSESSAQSAGVGLADARVRLGRLYGERASLALGPSALGGVAATLLLPFRAAFGERS
jgi:signal transduction histidine kinase